MRQSWKNFVTSRRESVIWAGKYHNMAPVVLVAILVVWSLEGAFHCVVLHSNHGEKPVEFASPTSTVFVSTTTTWTSLLSRVKVSEVLEVGVQPKEIHDELSGAQAGLLLPEAAPHRRSSKPLSGLRALDVGCGGGLLSESLARLGAEVTGIDPSAENVAVASGHSKGDPLTRGIKYEAVTATELEARGERFDLVAALEVIEHVPDPRSFVASLVALTRPGGLLAVSTINRTPKSFALAIVAAEYLAGLVPVGTHDWRAFVRPEDLKAMLVSHGFPGDAIHVCGMIYNPISGRWLEDPGDVDVNYILTALRSSGSDRS